MQIDFIRHDFREVIRLLSIVPNDLGPTRLELPFLRWISEVSRFKFDLVLGIASNK